MSKTHKEPQTLLMFLVTFWSTVPIVQAVHAQPRLDFFQDFKSIYLEKVKIAQRAVFLCNGPYTYIYLYHDSGDVDLLSEASLRLGPIMSRSINMLSVTDFVRK